MGACTSATRQHKNVTATQFTLQQLKRFQVQNLPQLNFQASISNIKVKKCKYSKVTVKMDVQQVKIFTFAQKNIDNEGVAKWKIKKQFNFASDQYQLRKKRIIVQIFDDQNHLKGQLKLSLFKVATGPYHQDFLIATQDKKDFRISFDFKISQLIEVQSQILSTKVNLNTQYPGDIFTFYVKTIIGNSTWNSQPSYMIRIGLQQQLKKLSSNEKIKIKKHNSIADFQKVVPRGQQLVWNKQQCPDMPEFDIKFPFQQFSSASFQLTIWSIDSSLKTDFQKNPSSQRIVGSCVFSFNKLSNNKPQSYQVNGINFDKYEITLNQDVRQAGQTVGKAEIKLTFLVQEHIKQMHVCVNTQQGILKSSPVFTNQQSSNKELLQIGKYSESIDNKFIEFNKMKGIHQSTISLQEGNIVKQIEGLLFNLNKLLNYSYKQSIKLYKYGNQSQMLKGQKILLSTGFKLIQYVKQQNQQISNMCWPVIINLMNRGQFFLSHMGFKASDIQLIQKGQINDFLKKKIEVGVRYQQFLLKLLSIGVNSLNIKGFQQQKKFAQQFIAHAYFRIPKFRSQVLEAIKREDDPQIIQWRGTQFNLNSQQNVQISANQNTFLLLFDWGSSFHKCLQSNVQQQQNQDKLLQILKNKQWKIRMSKRRGAFFAAIGYWVQYIQQITQTIKDLKWQYFPGYNKIIEAFMVQMKITPIQQYPPKMKKAACKLLANQKLLNVFVAIIFNKANINNNIQIIKSIQTVMMFLQALQEKNKLIPSNFNIMFFYKSLKMIIQGQSAFSIAKVLIMLYQYFHLFSIQFQADIAMYLLGKVFFKLFLHWSNNVRVIFYHLLNYRIYFEADKANTKQSILKIQYGADVKKRYKRLLQMIQDLQQAERQIRSKNIVNKFEKDLYKKMKKKLVQKKKQVKGKRQSLNMAQRQNSMLQKQLKIQIKLMSLEPIVSNQTQNKKYIKETLPTLHASSSSNLYSENLKQQKFFKDRSNSTSSSAIIMKNIQDLQSNRKKDQIFDTQSPMPNFQSSTQINQTKVQYIDKSGKKSRKLSLKYTEDIQIAPPTYPQSNIVFTAMDQYLKAHQLYQAFVKKNIRTLPKVQIQIPIDSSQMRPENLDEW